MSHPSAESQLIQDLAMSDPMHAQGYMDDRSCFFCGAEEPMETEANPTPLTVHDPECIWLQAVKLCVPKEVKS